MPKKQNLIYGKPLIPNAGIAAWYKAQLKGLVRYMTDKVSREVLKLYKEIPNAVNYAQDDDSLSSQERILLNSLAEEIEKLFKFKAGQIADTMLKKQRKYAKFSVRQSIGAAIGKDLGSYIFGGPTEEDIEKAVKMENVNLIRNLSQEYLMRVKGAVARSIINGQGQKYLKQELSRFKKNNGASGQDTAPEQEEGKMDKRDVIREIIAIAAKPENFKNTYEFEQVADLLRRFGFAF